jgi:hypothetical protein
MTFFQRMIASSDRDCDNCGGEGVIEEGTLFYVDKHEDKWCHACMEYERQRES